MYKLAQSFVRKKNVASAVGTSASPVRLDVFQRMPVRYILVTEARVNWDLCVWNCTARSRRALALGSRVCSLVCCQAEFLGRHLQNETLKSANASRLLLLKQSRALLQVECNRDTVMRRNARRDFSPAPLAMRNVPSSPVASRNKVSVATSERQSPAACSRESQRLFPIIYLII